ncbi:MAG: VIT and vWA domain-containing protein [Chitinispirillaceae bacterium]
MRCLAAKFTGIITIFVLSAYAWVDVGEIKGPVCVISDTSQDITATLSPRKSTYNVLVTDGLAHVSLKQMFVNDFGDIDDIAYIFPLPHEASVHAMEMKYRDSLYVAEIYEKQKAQEIYDSIVNEGGNAALLLQERPNVFVQHLANIGFNDTAYIKIKLTVPLKYNNGEYELSIPTMVAQRFQSEGASPVGSSGLWNPPPDRDGQGLEINVLLQTGFSINGLESPTHPIEEAQVHTVKDLLVENEVIEAEAEPELPFCTGMLLSPVNTYPNSDFVLRFSREKASRDFSVATYYDVSESKGYYFCTIFPDTALLSSSERADLDIVLLIDISGSQGGWPIEKEKEIASMIVNKLRATDQLTVLSFSNSVQWCFGEGESVPATNENIEAANAFISGLQAGGGTQLLDGVRAALSTQNTTDKERYFIFLTDGFITNETAILDEINNHPTHPTVFTFGAGNNLNRYFLEESARVGNGFASEVTENESVESFVNDAWNKIESPQLSNLEISFSGNNPEDLLMPLGNRLYTGCPVVAYGTYTGGGQKTVTVSGNMDGEPVSFSKDITFASLLNFNPMIPQMWARQKIRQLQIEEGATESNKEQIIDLSLNYQVLSEYTAFLATDPQKEYEFIANPSRSDAISIGMPLEVRRTEPLFGGAMNIRIRAGLLTVEARKGDFIREIMIYDLQGRCVFRMNNAPSDLERFVWDGRVLGGGRLPGGKYVMKIRTVHAVKTHLISWH